MNSSNNIRERRLAAKDKASKAQNQLKIIGVASLAIFGLIALSTNNRIRACYTSGMYAVLRHVDSLLKYKFYARRGELEELRLRVRFECGLY